MSIYGTGDYAQTYTAESAEAERRHRQMRDDRFKALEQAQATIMNQLGIITRNGKSKASLERLKEAEALYAEAYLEVINSAPIAQAAISQRGR